MKKAEKAQGNQTLVDERLRHGWSQQEVADRVGTTPVNVSRWERGATMPSPYFRQQLSTLFGKSLQELRLLPQSTDMSQPGELIDQTIPFQGHSIEDESAPDSDSSLPTQETDQVFSPSNTERQGPNLPPRVHPPRQLPSMHLLCIFGLVLVCMFVLASTMYVLFRFHGIFAASSNGGAVVGMHTHPSGAGSIIISGASDAVPSVYGVHGLQVLNDALTSPQSSSSWHFSSPSKVTGCHLRNGGYDLLMDESNYCLVNHTSYLTNFVYQIDMISLQEDIGQSAGLIFRADDVLHHYYDFQVSSVDGSYRLLRSDPTQDGPDPAIANGYSPAIRLGNHSVNTLAVKAIGATLSLYINDQLIKQLQDSSYQEGNIGVGIDILRTNPQRTEVVFRSAKVWTIEE